MNSKNVIAICAYNKPDLLYLYLEQLYSDPLYLQDFIIEIHTEEGYDKEQDLVLDIYRNKTPKIEIKQIVKKKNPEDALVGFRNIVSSYFEPDFQPRTCDFVIVGEEDILPTRDYLRFNTYVYEEFLKKYPRIMGAAHKRRPETEMQGDPEVLIGDYQCTSLSVISARVINEHLLPFATSKALYSNPIGFYSAIFSESRMNPREHTHHDGFVERVMEAEKLFVLKPDQARSMHVGLSGIFCKGKAPEGTLEERVAEWKELIKDGDKLRSLSTHPQDMVVTDPFGPAWDKLILDPDRNLAKASSWWYDTKNEFKTYVEESNFNGS